MGFLPKPREEKEQRLSAGGAKEKYAMIWLFAAVAHAPMRRSGTTSVVFIQIFASTARLICLLSVLILVGSSSRYSWPEF
jgi:hypothetical protein